MLLHLCSISQKMVVTYAGLINHVAVARLIGMLAINKGRELTFKTQAMLARACKGWNWTL